MFDWENMRHFLAVAQAGTLSGAARQLRVDHATVGRRLAALEAELQTPLVERLPRACRLTAAGVRIAEQAGHMENAAIAVARQVKAQQASLQGQVTMNASPVLTTHFIAPRLADFYAAYPGIKLSINGEVRQVSLGRGEADVALRHTRPREPSNIARRIGRMPFALYASRRYRALTAPERWTFISYADQYADMPQQRWLLEIAGDRPVSCELSDISSHLAAARGGAGVAGLPCFLGDADAELIRLELDDKPFSRDVWLVTHREMKRSTLVRAVMDYFAEAFENDKAFQR
jgi:DNA-binding transcriptional LysR family regulator